MITQEASWCHRIAQGSIVNEWCVVLIHVVYSGGQVRPSHRAPTDDAPSISYGGKGFPTGGQVIPSISTMCACVCLCMIEIHKPRVLFRVFPYTHTHLKLTIVLCLYKTAICGWWRTSGAANKGLILPIRILYKTLTVYTYVCIYGRCWIQIKRCWLIANYPRLICHE